MSIRHNGRGRSYAICDSAGCDENVIDLPLDVVDADRVVRTFFGWTSVGERDHACGGCSPKRAARAMRRRRHATTWKRDQMKETRT